MPDSTKAEFDEFVQAHCPKPPRREFDGVFHTFHYTDDADRDVAYELHDGATVAYYIHS